MDTDHSRSAALSLGLDFIRYTQLGHHSADDVVVAAKTFHEFLAPSDHPTYAEDGPVGATTMTEAEWRKVIADQVRRNCTPSTEAYQAGGDKLIYAVADWIENPPEWSVLLPAKNDEVKEEWAKLNPEAKARYLDLQEAAKTTPSSAIDEGQFYRKGRVDAIHSLRAAAVGHLNSSRMVSEHDAADFLLTTLKQLFPDD